MNQEAHSASSVEVVVCATTDESVDACLAALEASDVLPSGLVRVIRYGSLLNPSTIEQHRREPWLSLEAARTRAWGGAVNHALRSMTRDTVVLLEPTSIVPVKWIAPLLAALDSGPEVAAVGPLTSSGRWQAVPSAADESGQIQVNRPVDAEHLAAIARYVSFVSPRWYPTVGFLDPTCLALRRSALKSRRDLSRLATRHYRNREVLVDDWARRLRDAGFTLVVADDLLVQTVPWSQRRGSADRAKFRRRTGAERLDKEIRFTADRGALRRMQKRVSALRACIEAPTHPELSLPAQDLVQPSPRLLGQPSSEVRPGSLRVLYLLHRLAIAGGVLSVTQIVNEMDRLGAWARIATLEQTDQIEAWPLAHRPMLYETVDSLISHCPEVDVVVATHWSTAPWARDLLQQGRARVAAYWVQDYEAWFYPLEDQAQRRAVVETYEMLDNKIVKSEWLRALLTCHGCTSQKIAIGMDLDVFCPAEKRITDRPVVTAVARFRTPRRGFPYVVDTLDIVKRERPDVQVQLFTEDLSTFSVPFEYKDLGQVRDRRELARIYAGSDVFLDGSNFQGLGRPGLEAMACGCPAVLTSVGGVNEYAVHEVNCLLVPPKDPEAKAAAIVRLLDDQDLSVLLRSSGEETAAGYCMKREASETLNYFSHLVEGTV